MNDKPRKTANFIQNNKWLCIIISIIIATAIIFGAVIVSNTAERKLQKQLDLGQKYIDELDYEQAVASYLAAIEIDPMCTDAYIGASEAYIGLEDYENATSILSEGYQATNGDESILSALNECVIRYGYELKEEGQYDELLRLRQQYEGMDSYAELDVMIQEMEAQQERDNAADSAGNNTQVIPGETGQSLEGTEGAEENGAQRENEWVDDLYDKMIAEDAEAVFEIITASDFIEKCSAYFYEDYGFGLDYKLLASNGESVWVENSVEFDDLYVWHCIHDSPDDPTLSAAGYISNEDCIYYIEDGKKEWFSGTVMHYSDGREEDLTNDDGDAIWGIMHA